MKLSATTLFTVIGLVITVEAAKRNPYVTVEGVVRSVMRDSIDVRWYHAELAMPSNTVDVAIPAMPADAAPHIIAKDPEAPAFMKFLLFKAEISFVVCSFVIFCLAFSRYDILWRVLYKIGHRYISQYTKQNISDCAT